MKTPTVIGAGLLALALFATVVRAQQAQTMQVGEGGSVGDLGIQLPERPRTGIGRIKGRVVTVDGGAPVRGAQVQISDSEGLVEIHVSDIDGRYEFRDLPSRTYTLKASKTGYMSAEYGQTRPFGQGRSIELMESRPVDGADVMMWRMAAISGRLVDEFGDPMSYTSVSAMRSTWVNGQRRLRPAVVNTALTNELGQYRLWDLNPGEYYISATAPSGREIMAMGGLWRFLSASEQSGKEPRSGYAITYYPGTPDGAEARRIALGPGEDRQNTDFALLPVKLSRVTVTVIGSAGRPVEGATVTATRRNSTVTIAWGSTDKSGNFTLPGVAPGEYTLRTHSLSFSRGKGGDLTASMPEFGSVPLTVSGDIARVTIVTSTGTTAAGRVTWEGSTEPGNTTALKVRAIPIESDAPTGADAAPVAPDGTFAMKGIAGLKLFRPVGVPQGWGVKSVLLNGQDIIDTGIDVKPNRPVTGLEIVLSSRVTEVSGSVRAGSDQTADYTVVIFAEDAQKWTMPMTRYVAGTRPNQDGRFQVRNLPPGSYYAVALEHIAQDDWNDPALLERLKAKATRFTLEEGKAERLELQLSGSYARGRSVVTHTDLMDYLQRGIGTTSRIDPVLLQARRCRARRRMRRRSTD